MLSLGGYVSHSVWSLLRARTDESVSDIDEHDQLAASQPVIENT